jgi:hypothetical protein
MGLNYGDWFVGRVQDSLVHITERWVIGYSNVVGRYLQRSFQAINFYYKIRSNDKLWYLGNHFIVEHSALRQKYLRKTNFIFLDENSFLKQYSLGKDSKFRNDKRWS